MNLNLSGRNCGLDVVLFSEDQSLGQPVIIGAGEEEVGSRMSCSACGESVTSAMSIPSKAADEGRGILNML